MMQQELALALVPQGNLGRGEPLRSGLPSQEPSWETLRKKYLILTSFADPMVAKGGPEGALTITKDPEMSKTDGLQNAPKIGA